MNELQNGVIKLIKSALTEERVSIPDKLDFEQIITICKNHQIAPLIYYGIINSEIKIENAVFKQIENLAYQSIAVTQNQTYELDKILQAFDENSINYMPLKGTIIKNIYPKPGQRAMSDLDILVKTEQYETIKLIMTHLGYKECGISDHELKWIKNNVYVELHSRLIPSYNKDYYAYYGDGWKLANLDRGTRYTLSNDDQMIYLFTHFAKHYRDAGIGIKHFVDLWVYKNSTNLNEEYISHELVKLKLNDFYLNINKTLQTWFKDRPDDKMSDFITQYIFDCGAAGKKENYIISDYLKNNSSGSTEKTSKTKLKLYYVFFPYDKMCIKYPILKKHSFLLPIMWLVRIFSAIFKKNHNYDFNGITSEQIFKRQQSLKYVGLDFNFKE